MDSLLVIAHRGSSARQAENTVAAFRAAAQDGADWVELDVRRTRDGALAVHHGALLADGRAIVDVDAGDLPPSVPLLGAALDACTGMGVNVELKNLPREPDFDEGCVLAEAVAPVLRSAVDGGQPILVSSFHPATLARLRDVDPSLPTALLTFSMADAAATVADCVAAGHVALNPFDATVDAALVSRCHGAGLAVHVWTVDDPVRMAELASLGVDGLVTNVPAIAREIVDRSSR